MKQLNSKSFALSFSLSLVCVCVCVCVCVFARVCVCVCVCACVHVFARSLSTTTNQNITLSPHDTSNIPRRTCSHLSLQPSPGVLLSWRDKQLTRLIQTRMNSRTEFIPWCYIQPHQTMSHSLPSRPGGRAL